MPLRLRRIASGLSEDQISEINERISNLEDHSENVASYCPELKDSLEKTNESIKNLTQWIGTLNDSNFQIKESLQILEQALEDQQIILDHLTEKFEKLNLKEEN